jgi:hypothetical protein
MFDPHVGRISGLVKKNLFDVPRPLSGFISCAPPSRLGHYRVGNCSRSISDERSEFEGFLDRDILIL